MVLAVLLTLMAAISPYQPNVDWTDDLGNLMNNASGGFLTGAGNVPLLVAGVGGGTKYYWWVGGNLFHTQSAPVGTDDDLGKDGIWLYKTTDFSVFTKVGNILATPSPWTYVIRPHVLYNAANNNYVLWAHGYNIPAGSADRACVATSTAIDSGWSWNTATLNPDGLGYKDCNLFLDVDGSTAYTIYTNGNQNAIIVSKLSSDFLSAGISTVTAVSGSRESPALTTDHEGKYCLSHSVSNYYDSTLTYDQQYCFATSPLGTWTSSQEMFTTDPIGTNYTAQISQILKFNNGWMTLGDHWVGGTNLAASRQVWLPVDDVAQEPTSWALTRFQTPSNTLLLNLAAFFPLSEITTASNAVERVSGLNATVHGTAPSNVYGARLRSRVFSQSTLDYFEAANNAVFQTGTIDFWLSVWLYWNGSGSTPVLFAKDDQTTNREYACYLDTTNANKLTWGVSNNGTSLTGTVTSNSGLSSNTLTHLVVYHSTTLGKIGMFINGVQDNEVTYAGGVRVGTAPFTIGETSKHSGIDWSGRLRDLGLWKGPKPRAGNEVSWLYNAGLSLPYEFFASSLPPTGQFATVFAGVLR